MLSHTAHWLKTHVEKRFSAYRLRKYKKIINFAVFLLKSLQIQKNFLSLPTEIISNNNYAQNF